MTAPDHDEDRLLHSAASQNAQSILQARQRAEEELVRAKGALELRTEELAESLVLLRGSEEKVRAGFEQAGVGMVIAALDGRFVQVNKKCTELVGYTAAELFDRTLLDLTHPDDVPATRARLNELQEGRITDYSLEKRFLHKDGSVVWTLTTVAAMRDATGEPAQLIGVIEGISERKRAEQAVREGAERLQLALSAGGLGDWSWDAATDLVKLGNRTAELIGIQPTTPVSWTAMHAALRIQDRAHARLAFDDALESHSDYAVEYRVDHPIVGERWLAARGRGVYSDAGRTVGMIGVVQDISEHRRLEEVRLRLAAVVESCDDAIISKTLSGIITTWNIGAERMFGYRAEEIVGDPVTRLIPDERMHEETEILRRLQAGQRIEHYETVRVRKDGGLIDVSLTISPIKDASGVVIGVSKIARDITARKRADEELREESRILNLLNSTGMAIAADLDLETLIQTVTDATTELSGAEFGAFFYNMCDERGDAYKLFALAGAAREEFESLGYPRATALFAPTFKGEAPVRCEDVLTDVRYGKAPPHHGMPAGHLPVRSYLAVPVVSRVGEVFGGLFFGHSSVGVFTERIERVIVGVAAQASVAIDNARLYERVKRAAEERKVLLEAERVARSELERGSLMKDEFLATLSHELRTPLNAILGWAQILRTQDRSDDDMFEGLAVIERNARVQTQLINDLLDMSRIISGKVRLEVQRVDLQDVVKAAVASVRQSADSKGVRLHVVLDPLAGPIRGDPSRLQQCFWNLLSNAIKFTPKGGKVAVSLERVQSHVEVSVADDGKGIAAEFLPHVFERFRQADASTTRHQGGLGLGLSIVKSLVELHGGTVRANSNGEGRGSRFSIELPVMALDETRAHDGRVHPRADVMDPKALDHASLQGLSVLVVDDERDARTMVKRVLEDCGASVFVAESAKEALAIVRRERPSVIVSDIGMPDVDGYDFIRQVRQLPADEGGRTPAAALSAFARAEDRTRALRAGFQMHLAKPVESTELSAVVFSLAAKP